MSNEEERYKLDYHNAQAAMNGLCGLDYSSLFEKPPSFSVINNSSTPITITLPSIENPDGSFIGGESVRVDGKQLAIYNSETKELEIRNEDDFKT